MALWPLALPFMAIISAISYCPLLWPLMAIIIASLAIIIAISMSIYGH